MDVKLILLLSFLSCGYAIQMNACYWGTWSYWRGGDGHFGVNEIDPFVCTHFIYSFLGANEDGSIYYMDSWLDIDLGQIRDFVGLRNRNPNANFLFSVGGWNAGSRNFSIIAANPSFRQRFVQDAVRISVDHGFQGFDLDWEYPNQRDTVHGAADVQNFVTLCQELYTALHAAGKTFGIAVAATATSASLSYDVPRISPWVDFILVMTYDFHGSWNAFTGIHGAMYPGPFDVTPVSREWNVAASLQWWVQQGAPRNKLVVGLPSYGRTFTLANTAQNGVNAPSIGAGNPGEYSGEAGFLTNMEVCQRVLHRGWIRQQEYEQRVPWAFQGNQWVGYDDADAINYKLDYIEREGFLGSMWWSLESDDFRNLCGQGRNPLIQLAQNRVR